MECVPRRSVTCRTNGNWSYTKEPFSNPKRVEESKVLLKDEELLLKYSPHLFARSQNLCSQRGIRSTTAVVSTNKQTSITSRQRVSEAVALLTQTKRLLGRHQL
eukprot:77462-Prorocentrum_minimum.AAC.5